MRHACRTFQIALFAALCLSGAGAQQGESPGTDPAAALEAGDAAYQRGDFAGAREQYLAAIRQGLDGARVLYNLGNAYYRTGEMGRAIACYERAATLAPRDDDVRANLDRALVERPSGAVAPPPTWLHMLGRRLIGSFTLTEFAVCAAALYWLAVGLCARMLLRPERRRRLGRLLAVTAALLVLVSAAGLARWWSYHHVHRAVVAQERVELRSGPGESFERVQLLHDGGLVRVVRGDGRWLQVVAEGGAQGWLAEGDIAKAWHTAEDTGT